MTNAKGWLVFATWFGGALFAAGEVAVSWSIPVLLVGIGLYVVCCSALTAIIVDS